MSLHLLPEHGPKRDFRSLEPSVVGSCQLVSADWESTLVPALPITGCVSSGNSKLQPFPICNNKGAVQDLTAPLPLTLYYLLSPQKPAHPFPLRLVWWVIPTLQEVKF